RQNGGVSTCLFAFEGLLIAHEAEAFGMEMLRASHVELFVLYTVTG
ncbi:hypothetical protein V3C99_002993, partial [Haemonchus contortus]